MKIREALLLENEILEEGISPVVFHATDGPILLNILRTNAFNLSPAFAKPVEGSLSKKLYYLSTARTRTGRYHSKWGSGVLIELDGRKLSQNYSGSPIDYWGHEWRVMEGGQYEQEDRVYSDSPHIKNATRYIRRVDINLEKVSGDLAVRIYSQLRKARIPVRVYETMNDWVVGSTKFLSHEQIVSMFEGQTSRLAKKEDFYPSPDIRDRQSFERYYKDTFAALYKAIVFEPNQINKFTKEERSRLDKIIREASYRGNYFETDFHNMVKNPNATNILSLIGREMKKRGIRDLKELNKYVHDKWSQARW